MSLFKFFQFLLPSFQVSFSSRLLSSGHVVEDWTNQIREAKRWGQGRELTNDVSLLQMETVQMF